MGLYSNFLSITGRVAKQAYDTARRLTRPTVAAVTQIAQKVKNAASVLTIVPLVGSVAASVLTVSTAVVGTAISDLLGPDTAPSPPPRQWETETMIFDGNDAMNRALDRDGDVSMGNSAPILAPAPVSRPVFDTMTYAGRPIAAPRGRQIYPRLRLDAPDLEMFDADAEVPYDRPEDTRSAKRFMGSRSSAVTSVA